MAHRDLRDSALTKSVIGAFYEVYNALRFGFLEQVYGRALERELVDRGHRVAREAIVRVRYKGEVVGRQRIDFVVDERLVVEIKSTIALHPSATRQVLSYLRATDLELGLLLHFGPNARFYRLIATNRERAPAELPGVARAAVAPEVVAKLSLGSTREAP